jgi:hypothetical protein
MRKTSQLVAWLLAGAFGCIVEAPGGDKSPERARAIAVQVPPLSLRGGANLEGKVELAGGSIQPGKLVPGEQARATVFFKVLEELDREYVVFVHVEDADGRLERFNLDHRPAGGTYPTTQWKKGETVKDEFSITLPPSYTAQRLNLWIGLWEPVSDTRLKLRNPESVKSDGKNRILLAQVPVGL